MKSSASEPGLNGLVRMVGNDAKMLKYDNLFTKTEFFANAEGGRLALENPISVDI